MITSHTRTNMRTELQVLNCAHALTIEPLNDRRNSNTHTHQMLHVFASYDEREKLPVRNAHARGQVEFDARIYNLRQPKCV